MDIKQLYQLYQKNPVITTDSRNCPEGSIFFALKGASFDGNLFAIQALEKGCAYAVIDDPQVAEDKQAEEKGLHDRLILVDNVLRTFQQLAREHRRQFNIPVVGITGTNGKTTTKELTNAVLSEKYNVLATQGNFNNDIGVPKTLFNLKPEHEVAIIEMGASHPGDIKVLAETAEPTCGIITNVGKAHLQGFGSFQGVISTKGELYDFLSSREESVIFIDADNQYLTDILPDNAWVTPYTTNENNAEGCVCGQLVACDPYLRFKWRESGLDLEDREEEPVWYEVQTKLIGSYNLGNALAAITIGLQFAIEPEKICHALENYTPTNNRSQLITTPHNHLVMDAYNANPTSMEAALTDFSHMESREEHGHIVKVLKRLKFDKVWVVGDEFANIKCHFRKFHDVEEVKAAIAEEQPQGYYIFIKGSNGNKLSQLQEIL